MLRADSESGSDRFGIELLRKMMPGAAIRRGHAGDLAAVSQLLKSAGLPTADLASAHEFQSWVLEEEGSILGVIGLERFGREALLCSLAVAATHRKRGLGHELVARLERDGQAEGVQQLVLLTETAQPFFRRLGYTVTDRSHVSDAVKNSAEFRSLCPVSAICMSKALRDG
jgi:amino-acid N-acetyltransferase